MSSAGSSTSRQSPNPGWRRPWKRTGSRLRVNKRQTASPPKLAMADITYLAKTWEERLRALDYPTRTFGIDMIMTLCGTFLRGRGVRMGNYTTLNRHLPALAQLATSVFKRISTDPFKKTWFPTLERLGFTCMEDAAHIINEHWEARQVGGGKGGDNGR